MVGTLVIYTAFMDALERFLPKFRVDEGTGCWVWAAAADPRHGYGRFWFQGRVDGAHRASVILHGREIPEGHEVDHLCRNPACVNPDHLDVVDRAENVRRSLAQVTEANRRRAAQRTHCKKGHALDEDNVAIFGDGKRRCRTCFNESCRQSQRRARGVA